VNPPPTPAKPEAPATLPNSVRTRSAFVHVYAHEGPSAIDFGLVGPSGTALTVIGPALEGRVFVFNPVTENYGWVNLTDVVTMDGAPVGVPDLDAPATPAPITGDVVTMVDGVHLWSNATSAAVDFGVVGQKGSRLTLVGPREGARALVINPATENVAWVDLDVISAPAR
jgi:hypothetical protein